MGRPSKYETHVKPKLELVIGWARDGLTDEDIAHNLNIALSTFYEYKKVYSEFSDILNQNREVIDYRVENALLKRALGYRYQENTMEADALGELMIKKVVTKEVVPDVAAQIFWLKNRKPKSWRDKQEVNEPAEDRNVQININVEDCGGHGDDK